MSKSSDAWKKRLEPLAQMYAAIYATVDGLDDADLAALIDAAKRPTQTNCWWATFQVAPIVRQMAEDEMGRRRRTAVLAVADREETGDE